MGDQDHLSSGVHHVITPSSASPVCLFSTNETRQLSLCDSPRHLGHPDGDLTPAIEPAIFPSTTTAIPRPLIPVGGDSASPPIFGAYIEVVEVLPAQIFPPMDILLTAGPDSASSCSFGTDLAVLEVVTAPISPPVDVFAMGPATVVGTRRRQRAATRATAARCRLLPVTRTRREGNGSLRSGGDHRLRRCWYRPIVW